MRPWQIGYARRVHRGSGTKSLSPALRLDWMVLPDFLIDNVLSAKGTREMRAGVITQLTLADVLSSGAIGCGTPTTVSAPH
ncbi:hypothetical protein [Nocardia sp. NPDC046763]|uniref:hypothetical protein n=1 Tax=Nocardia sp. NPDC046763 TaxID=3155256 RepID=UPI0033C8530E